MVEKRDQARGTILSPANWAAPYMGASALLWPHSRVPHAQCADTENKLLRALH